MREPIWFTDPESLAEAVIARVGKTIVLGLPLGVGKANHVANALYARALADPSIKLRIFTALTLETPHPRQDLERRFMAPLSERLFAGFQSSRTAWRSAPGDCRRISKSTSSSFSPAAACIRRRRSRATSRQTTRTRRAMCLIAALMCSLSWLPNASAVR